MFESFSSFCDDFYADMYINTELDLPSDRDIVLSFFDRLQREFPSMANFYRRDDGDFCLEEDREKGSYRWVLLEIDRICSGCVNPASLKDAYSQHKFINSLLPYMLGINHLDIASVDLNFAMLLDCCSNHDEVVYDAFFAETAFKSVMDIENARPIGFSPRFLYSLSEDCRTQLRISIESKTTVYEIRNRKYDNEKPIVLSASLRQYHKPDEKFDLDSTFSRMCAQLEQITAEKIIPGFLQPLKNSIAYRK